MEDCSVKVEVEIDQADLKAAMKPYIEAQTESRDRFVSRLMARGFSRKESEIEADSRTETDALHDMHDDGTLDRLCREQIMKEAN